MEDREDEVQPADEAVIPAGSAPARVVPLATVLVGLVMLVVGTLAGYFGRPLLEPQTLSPTPVAVAKAAGPAPQAEANPSANDPTVAGLMDALVSSTRHFKGDPNAPITIIEFGDFQ